MKMLMNAAKMAALLVAFFCAAPFAAHAEGTMPGYVGIVVQSDGVMTRERPAYDPKGIPLGGFRLFPTLNVLAVYDDNVFKGATGVSDYFFVTSPAVRLQSQWGRHFVEVYSGVNNYNYVSYTGQNLTDWRIGTDGRLDISRAWNVGANVYYGYMHELWSSPNAAAGFTPGFQAAPNRNFQTHADVISTYQPNRLGLSAGISFDRYNWTTTPKIGGGLLFNDDRDQNEYQGFLKVNYDFSPGYSTFLKVSYDDRDFDMSFDRSGLRRTSHGYRLDGGINLKITHLLSGEISVGYLQQDFAQNVPAPLKNVSGLDYNVQLDWYATPNLTVHLSGQRTLDDVILAGASVADNKKVMLSADYEFRPNIIMLARASYTQSRYIGSTRTDTYPTAGVGIKYLVNNYADLNLNYDYSDRSTNSAALKYTDSTVGIGITLHI